VAALFIGLPPTPKVQVTGSNLFQPREIGIFAAKDGANSACRFVSEGIGPKVIALATPGRSSLLGRRGRRPKGSSGRAENDGARCTIGRRGSRWCSSLRGSKVASADRIGCEVLGAGPN
jgi:hypothetical protein